MHILYIYISSLQVSLRFILFLKVSSVFPKTALFINFKKKISKAFFALDLLFVLKSIYFANQGDS